jgi:hypothetical protein
MTGVSVVYTPVQQQLGTRDYTVLWNAACTTAGAAAELVNSIINVGSGDLVTGGSENKISLIKLEVSSNGCGASLSWNGSTNQQVWSIPLNFSKCWCFEEVGGLVNNNLGTSNNLLISTNGWTTNTGSLSIIAVFRRK